MKRSAVSALVVIYLMSGSAFAANNALDFDGVDDLVDAGDPVGNEFDLVGNFTIEAWVRVATNPPAHLGGTVFTVVGKDQSLGSFPKWIFGLQNGGLAFHINGPAYGSGHWTYSNAFAQPLDSCYHVAITKSLNTYAFYLNGAPIGGGTFPVPLLDVPAPLTIGFSEPCCRYQGEIDEVRIWNVTRTGGAILADMSEALTGSESGLVAYYDMNQSGSSDLLDQGPNGFDGSRLGGGAPNPTPQFVPSCSPVTEPPPPLAMPAMHVGAYVLLTVLLAGVAAARLRLRP